MDWSGDRGDREICFVGGHSGSVWVSLSFWIFERPGWATMFHGLMRHWPATMQSPHEVCSLQTWPSRDKAALVAAKALTSSPLCANVAPQNNINSTDVIIDPQWEEEWVEYITIMFIVSVIQNALRARFFFRRFLSFVTFALNRDLSRLLMESEI